VAESGTKHVLRPFSKVDDYEMYCNWWDDVPPPMSSLPKIGFNYDNKACGFLALTDCDFSIITFWHANPENKPNETHKALTEIIRVCIASSVYYGRKRIFCYTHKRGIIKILEREGFVNNEGHLVGVFHG